MQSILLKTFNNQYKLLDTVEDKMWMATAKNLDVLQLKYKKPWSKQSKI